MMSTRYLIDEQGLDPEISLAFYRTALAWAASQGDRFVLSLQQEIYDDSEDVGRLCSLGTVRKASELDAPRDFITIITKLFGRKPNIILVEGKPEASFVRELTRKAAPRRAVAGDVSPVEDVMVFSGERNLYACYDYGRTQVLDLADDELESLCQSLKEAGLDPTRIIPAPPHLSNAMKSKDSTE